MDSKLCAQIRIKTGLPAEIFDEILVKAIDLNQAITLKNYYVVNKIYNPSIHHWYYAAINGNLEVVKFLYEKRKGICSVYTMEWAAEYFNEPFHPIQTYSTIRKLEKEENQRI